MANGCYTGYIHNLLDENQSLAEFAQGCAGAHWDEAWPPKDYADELAAADAKLRQLQGRTPEEQEIHGVRERTDHIVSLEAQQRVHQDEALRLNRMLVQVEACTPPPECGALRLLMLRQLHEALTQAYPDFYEDLLNAARARDAASYYQEALADARGDVAYYENQALKEQEWFAEKERFRQAFQTWLDTQPAA